MSEQVFAAAQQINQLPEFAPPVSELPESGWMARVDRWRANAARAGKAVLGAAAIMVPGGAVAAESASGAPPEAIAAQADLPVQITSLDTTYGVHIGESSMSDGDFSQATVLGNHRSISKAKLRKVREDGGCRMFDGDKTRIYTQGHYESGNPYGRDTRTSLFCKYKGQWYRYLCGNKASIHTRPRYTVEGRIIWVNNYNKAKMTVSAHSKAVAQAECRTVFTSAAAYGEGSGDASTTLRIRDITRTKGKMTEVETEQRLSAEADARSSATAKAVAVCADRPVETPPPSPTPPPPSPPPPPPPGPPTPPQPKSHSCSVENILQKDGRTTNMTVVSDGGNTAPTGMNISWGDNGMNSYTNPSSVQTSTHTYNADNTYGQSVSETFADGGSAVCAGSITTKQETVPPPPAY